MKPVLRAIAILLFVAAVVPAALAACPLCKDAKSDSDYAGGTASLPNGFYYSIVFMVCAPFLVVGGLVTRIVLARRRLRALPAGAPAPARPSGSGELVPGAAGSGT
ncbi:MAG: hypothetical protein ABI592_07525 [Acidobacteriota bacterium]